MCVILATVAREARSRAVDTPPEPIGRANIILIPNDNAMVTLDRRAASTRRSIPASAHGVASAAADEVSPVG